MLSKIALSLISFIFIVNLQNLYSAEKISLSLDSIVRYDAENVFKSKESFKYDHQGNLVQATVSYPYDNIDGRNDDMQTLYEYDYKGNLISFTVKLWDYDNNSWEFSEKKEYKYTEKNKYSEFTKYKWSDKSSNWIPDKKTKIEYNADGNETMYYTFLWDNEWETVNKAEYIYDGSKVSEIIYHRKTNNSSLLPYMKYVYNYGSSEKATSEKVYHYPDNKEELLYDKKMSYDNKGNIIDNFRQKYSSETQDLVNDFHSMIEYDNNGNLLQKINLNWNTKKSAWDYSTKDVLKYDNNNNLVSTEKYDVYNYNNDEWLPSFKTEYIIDAAENNTVIFMPKEIEQMNSGKIISSNDYLWSEKEDKWELIDKREFFYSNNLTTVSEPKETIKVYPNPADNNISISGLENHVEFSIYNISGDLVFSKEINPSEKIEISELSLGTYIWKFENNGTEYSGKFIKK